MYETLSARVQLELAGIFYIYFVVYKLALLSYSTLNTPYG